ncbi:uncharacterized protein LOC106650787 [Trichogramma pretiosum]|uniref:uncharacterized protein LOC106650787 n=1 Tax=Trichogramma pretiosum TaxID=7493 RepID=UPI000C71BCF2|nr:uncharacterized protein LOC106650787 [Trichogramma pretiosum]
MSKRKLETSASDAVEAKKQKEIEYSSNIYLESIEIGDKHGIVIGYVETIFDEEEHTTRDQSRTFKLRKFLLNNTMGYKIQCHAYNDNIRKFMPDLKEREKIMITDAQIIAKTRFSQGTAPFDINLILTSQIEKLGTFVPTKKIKKVTFQDVKHSLGNVINIQGYLRSTFRYVNNKTTTESVATITDGQWKLIISISTSETLNFERGSKLDITGELDYKDDDFHLNILNIKNISVIEGSTMDLEDLIKGSKRIVRN